MPCIHTSLTSSHVSSLHQAYRLPNGPVYCMKTMQQSFYYSLSSVHQTPLCPHSSSRTSKLQHCSRNEDLHLGQLRHATGDHACTSYMDQESSSSTVIRLVEMSRLTTWSESQEIDRMCPARSSQTPLHVISLGVTTSWDNSVLS